MSYDSTEPSTQQIDGHTVRTVMLDGTEYVSVQDFCLYLQGLLNRVVELTQSQQDHLSYVGSTLDVLCEVLSAKDPDIRAALAENMARQSMPS